MPRNTKKDDRPALVREAKAFAEARMLAVPALKRSEALEWTARELGFRNWNDLTGYAAAHPCPEVFGLCLPAYRGPAWGHAVVLMHTPDHFAAKVAARLWLGPADRVWMLPDISPENAASHFRRLREDRKCGIRLICPVSAAYLEDRQSGPLVGQRFWEVAQDLCAFGDTGLSRMDADAFLHAAMLLSFPGKSASPDFESVGPQREFRSPSLS